MNQGAHHRLLTPTRSRLSPTSRSTSRTTVANTGWLIARCRRMPVRKPPALSRHPRAAMLRRGPVINRNPINPKIWGICPAIKHRDTAEMKVLFGTHNAVIKITIGDANIPVAPPTTPAPSPTIAPWQDVSPRRASPHPSPLPVGKGVKAESWHDSVTG
jgi:hypothetical protein